MSLKSTWDYDENIPTTQILIEIGPPVWTVEHRRNDRRDKSSFFLAQDF